MKIIEKKLTDLVEYENNPRFNERAIEAVANSIKEFGFKNPIIIDKDNVIIAGHTRKKAAERLGLETAPCIMADDLTEDQVKAFRLVDNKTAELADWDFQKLQEEIEVISMDLAAFGFDNADLYDGDLEDFFQDQEPKEKEPKKVQCPHCGEWFEC